MGVQGCCLFVLRWLLLWFVGGDRVHVAVVHLLYLLAHRLCCRLRYSQQGRRSHDKGCFCKDVSLEALLNHIQDEYTAFWDVVFKDLVVGLEMFNGAFAIFVAVCLVVMMYALSVCCCRPYTGKKAPQDASQQKDGGVLV